jgi:hypothetical protein
LHRSELRRLGPGLMTTFEQLLSGTEPLHVASRALEANVTATRA